MTVAGSALVTAWLAGVLGGVHCISMCGGFAAAFAARDAAKAQGMVTLHPAPVLARRQLAYHAGRLSTYALLGTLFGASGSAALHAANVLTLQQPLYLLANVALIAVALRLAFRTSGAGWLARHAMRPLVSLGPRLSALTKGDGLKANVALGLAWGLVPCALVYSVLPVAMFAGGAWQGALVMLAFGVGTLPTFAAGSLLLTRLRAWSRHALPRYAAAMLVFGFAIAGIYRVAVLHDLAGGPFCLLP